MKLSIPTSQGKYKYQFVPLFEGVMTINKEVAARNLSLFKQILDRQNIPFLLAYGTLLGAVREHDFISHDEDIDLNMDKKYQKQLFDSLFILREAGFEVCRYDRRGVISFMRNGEYIDIYIFDYATPDVMLCGREIMPAKYLTETTTMMFKDEEYIVPAEYENYLSFFYGENWRTPVKFYNYAQPLWRRTIHTALQYFKELLPDSLFFSILGKKDRRDRAPFVAKLNAMGYGFEDK